MSFIAVAAIGVGAAIGATAVAAGVAVATVITVAAVVGVIGVGLTVIGAVTHNKLLGQIGMVMGMVGLGAAGGAAGAGALGAGEVAAAEVAPTVANAGVTEASLSATPAAEGAGGAVDFGAVAKGAPVNYGAVAGAGEGPGGAGLSAQMVGEAKAPVAALSSVASQAAPSAADLSGATPAENPYLVRASQPVSEGSFSNSGGGGGGRYGLARMGAPSSTPVPTLPTAPTGLGVSNAATTTGVEGTGSFDGLMKFFNSNAGGAVLAGAPGALMQGVGGMLQGQGTAFAAEKNYQMQQQQLALQRAQWERGNSAAAIRFNH